jgi:putative ABC transport system ATP-binding protein
VDDRDGRLLVDVTTPVLDARDLYRFFHAGNDETLALRGVSLSVSAGELVAVTGPSGSGKSTLLACLAGLDDPDGGMVRIDGEPLSHRPETERAVVRARSVGMLFQSNNLFGHLTVTANLTLARSLASKGRGNNDLLEQFGLGHRRHAYPTELSGGEAARAGLAMALANEPPILLADEPTGELDSTTATIIVNELCRQAERGTAIVVVTHSPLVAVRAHRVVCLQDGQVVS